KRDRQGTPYRSNRSFQAELAEHCDPVEPLTRDLFGCREDTERDREIESRTLFADVGGREVNRDAFEGEGETGVRERRGDAVASFLYCTLRQAYGDKGGEAIRNISFNFNEIGIDAKDRGRSDPCEHR